MRNLEKMKKLILALAVILLLTSCNSNNEYLNDDDIVKIGFIPETMTVERWQRDRDIFVAKVKELGAEVIVKNAYEDSEIQKQIGIEMIDQGVDVLVIVVYDKNSLSDLVSYAHSKNVKVIAYDRLIKNANVDLYITFDNFRVGELIGESIIEQVPNGNYLILNGSETDNNAFMFRDGYMSMVQPKIDNGDIKVVGETWVTAWRDEISYVFVSGILAQEIHIDGIVASNDRVAEGAINALSENRIAGDIIVTGQDAELAACQRIVEGMQYMTVYKPIQTLAEGAAEIAVKMALGEEIPVEQTIFDGTYNVNYIKYEPIGVTKENINETVIEDGFYTYEQVYLNLPKEEWHKND
jgi:D-xylose transport system substrate-binding protein